MKYRSYSEAKQAIEGIEFTQWGKYTSPSEFARKARYWSPSTFKRRVAQAKRNMQKRENRRKLIEAGYTRKLADSMKHYKPSKIREATESMEVRKISDIKIPLKRRKDAWSDWAREEKYPDWLKGWAEDINIYKGFDITASYGWAVLYYAFMRDEDPMLIMKDMKVDRHDGDIYQYDKLIKSFS